MITQHLCPVALTCQESWPSAAVLELCVCGPHKMGNSPLPQNLPLQSRTMAFHSMALVFLLAQPLNTFVPQPPPGPHSWPAFLLKAADNLQGP